MSWLRSSGPKPTTRYSFTVNFEAHPELEPLAHHLWALPPSTKTRNQAILKVLQAGFQSMLLQGGLDGGLRSPASSGGPSPASPPAPGARPAGDSVATPAREPALSPKTPTFATAEPPSPPPGLDESATGFSSAASRFLNQFGD